MSDFVETISASWAAISLAIDNKKEDPQMYERFYIGHLQKQSSGPIFDRKSVQGEKSGQQKYFYLSSPLEKVPLTRREVQVLHLICKGRTNKLAAQQVGLSPRTVEYYIQNIRKKTLAVSKKDLISQALKGDFLDKVRDL